MTVRPSLAARFAPCLLLFAVARSAHAQATCADPGRTLALSGAAACRAYDQDPAVCATAWAVTQNGGEPVTCFYAANQTCQGCGPTNQADHLCVNTCVASKPVPAQTSAALCALATLLLLLSVVCTSGLARSPVDSRGSKRRQRLGWFALCAALASAEQVRADDVTLFASRDTTIYERGAGLSNGKGDAFFSGRNGNGSPRRALLAFDIAASLPTGAKITNVVLTLALTRDQKATTTVALHRVTSAWGEGASVATGQGGGGGPASDGDATWTHRRWPMDLWTTAGGDFLPTASATTQVGDIGTYRWTSPELAQDVQAFLDDATTNQGWILIGDAMAGAASKRFSSRENAGSAPTLTLTYTPPAATTGACCLPDGSCGSSLDPGTACQGSYRGAGTTCRANTCPELTGACCLPTAAASCEQRTKTQCGTNPWQGANASCEPNPCPVVLTPFVDPLPLPAVATPIEGTAGGAATYRLRVVQTQQQLHRDLPPTTVWGYDDGVTGGYPGPTIEARSGAPVRVIWANDLRDSQGQFLTTHVLPVDTCLHGAANLPRIVVHLHGGHVPARSDGHPEMTLLPGEQTNYDYPNAQRAATIWYHDHAIGVTRLNVYMGLAGFYLIRDDEEDKLGLPSGKYEIPLAIQDRSFNPDGSLRYPETWQESVFGNTLVVNGKVTPYLTVDQGEYRFRILNGSTSRSYTLSLSNGRSLLQIGNDGGLLPESFSTREVTVAPGERADIIIDFSYGKGEVILHNSAKSPFPFGGAGPDLTSVMKFIVTDTPGFKKPVAVRLSSISPLTESDAVLTRDLVLQRSTEDHCGAGMWLINGKDWNEITETPHLGTSEIWRFINRSGLTHPMHIHSLFFQVLDRQPFELKDDQVVVTGDPRHPERAEAGWKDTVEVGPFEIVRVIARFEDYAGRFPYHCHLLEHEDHGMMRQFEALAVCGDHAVARGFETCDDGNTRNGDGCDSQCKIESATADRHALGDAGAPHDAAAVPGAAAVKQPKRSGAARAAADHGDTASASSGCSVLRIGDRSHSLPWMLGALGLVVAMVRRGTRSFK